MLIHTLFPAQRPVNNQISLFLSVEAKEQRRTMAFKVIVDGGSLAKERETKEMRGYECEGTVTTVNQIEETKGRIRLWNLKST